MYIPDAQTLGGSAKTTLNLVDFFLQIGFVGKLVLLLLLFFSVASWAVVFFKWKVITGELQASRRFFKSFSKAKNLQEIYLASQKSSDTILGDAFISAYQEAASQVRAQGNQEEKRINLDIIERLVTHRLNDGVESLERKESPSWPPPPRSPLHRSLRHGLGDHGRLPGDRTPGFR